MIVLDASATIELLLRTDLGAAVADRIRDVEESLHAPHLIDVEVAQVLRRYAQHEAITANEGAEALDALQSLDIERYDHRPLLSRVWSLRGTVSAYDAVYVAVAEALEAPLLTTDRKLSRAGLGSVRIEVVRN